VIKGLRLSGSRHPGPVSTRLAQVSDARAIAVVHVRSWQAAYRGLLPQDYLDQLDPDLRIVRWEEQLRQAQWPRQVVVVAEDAGEVVGFARVCPARDADLDPAITGEVTSIYLLREAWGQGLGRQLMTAALAALTAAGFREAVLWVLDTNARARSFYQAGGWSPDGSVKQDELAGFPLREVRYRCPVP
jgi:GNAT superfamily N-acetyltransferase